MLIKSGLQIPTSKNKKTGFIKKITFTSPQKDVNTHVIASLRSNLKAN